MPRTSIEARPIIDTVRHQEVEDEGSTDDLKIKNCNEIHELSTKLVSACMHETIMPSMVQDRETLTLQMVLKTGWDGQKNPKTNMCNAT